MAAPDKAELLFNFERSTFHDPSWMLSNAGERIVTIAPWEVNICEEPIVSDTEVEVLCTYSWNLQGTRNTNPMIFAPGFPRRWDPPALPFQLPLDGLSLIDAHAHWAGTYQFEPTFQAMRSMNPEARLDDVDIIINRNSLVNLFRFVSGGRTDQFHLDMHIVGKTLLLGRKERMAIGDQRGHGHAFEDIFAKELNEDADTHHRVIRYNFGNLNLVIRHEVDAYCEDSDAEFREVFRGPDIIDCPEDPIQLPIPHETATAVTPRGINVSQSQIAELKTSGRGSAIRQCWFGRTPNLCVAKAKSGLVKNAEMKDVWSDCVLWELRQQQSLRRLAGLLGQLQETMMHSKSGRGVLVRMEKEAPLQIYEGKEGMKDALPQEMKSHFWRQEGLCELAAQMDIKCKYQC